MKNLKHLLIVAVLFTACAKAPLPNPAPVTPHPVAPVVNDTLDFYVYAACYDSNGPLKYHNVMIKVYGATLTDSVQVPCGLTTINTISSYVVDTTSNHILNVLEDSTHLRMPVVLGGPDTIKYYVANSLSPGWINVANYVVTYDSRGFIFTRVYQNNSYWNSGTLNGVHIHGLNSPIVNTIFLP